MDIQVSMLITTLAAAGAVGASIDPDLAVSAEQESKAVIQELDERKRAEYQLACSVVKGCKVEGAKYVF